MFERVLGHYWTIAPHVGNGLKRQTSGTPWSTIIDDPVMGPVRLSGRLDAVTGSKTLVIVVHGLGGRFDSPYMNRFARACRAHSISCLRVALRGADLSGEDFYHSGLYSDIEAVLSDSSLQDFERIYLVGYSLGGHVVLHTAIASKDPRFIAAAAICAPLDLSLAAAAIDAPRVWVYRKHILRGLKRMYAEIAKRKPVPTPMSHVQQVSTLHEWDALTVVPRFGFDSVQDYHAKASVHAKLHLLQRPTLVVVSEHDPMVPMSTLNDALTRLSPSTVVCTLQIAGHCGFPANTPLGLGFTGTLENQALAFLLAQ